MQVLRKKTVDGKKSVVVPGNQQVEEVTVVSYFSPGNGLYTLLVAEVNKVPGIRRAVDIGQRKAPCTGFCCRLYQFFGFESAV